MPTWDEAKRRSNTKRHGLDFERGDEPHIISLRKAEKHEVKRYIKEISR